MIQAVAQRLIDGATAEEATAMLKERYLTDGSLSTAMSAVRAAILDSGHRPASYDESELRTFATHPTVAHFLCATPREQYRIQRAHRRLIHDEADGGGGGGGDGGDGGG